MSTASTTQFFHDFAGDFYSRRLLLHTSPFQSSSTAAYPTPGNSGDNRFDANAVMVLSVLLCALICSLGLNSVIRWALRCSNLVGSHSTSNPTAKSANKGVKKKALKTFPTVKYSHDLKLPGLDTECVICLSEFNPGERVRLLPKCNHGFHVQCIDKWLNSHSSCPKCRHCLIETCQKVVGCSQPSSSETSPPSQETIVRIVPLEPEGFVRNFGGIS